LEALKSSFWFDPESKRLLANGLGYANPASLFHGTARMVNVLSLAGPGVSHNIQRALNVRNLQRKNPITREQADYLDHKGSYLPEPRLRDTEYSGDRPSVDHPDRFRGLSLDPGSKIPMSPTRWLALTTTGLQTSAAQRRGGCSLRR
jgi:hypothetical protein